MKKIVCAAALSVLLAACSSTPENQNAAPVDDRSAVPGAGAGAGSSTNPAGNSSLSGSAIPPTASTQQPPANAGRRSMLTDPSSPLSRRSVFYDYDSFVIKDEFKPLIEAHGRYLRDNRAAHVIVQGNTDE